MKQKEINKIINTLKHSSTSRLSDIRDDLNAIPDARELTKRMYFWSDFGNARERARFSRQYDEDCTIRLTKDLTICYWRSVRPSRNYAHAQDELYGITPDGKITITCADTKKLVIGIDAILSDRCQNEDSDSDGHKE